MTSLKQTSLGLLLNRFGFLSMDVVWISVFRNGQFQKFIKDLVRQDQLYKKGIDEDGDIIGLYSEWTEMINPSKVAGTPYTLYDTGEFYDSFIIFVGRRFFEIDADTLKMEDQKWWYENGITKDAILGLTEENKNKLAIEVRERFIKESRILLGFG